MRKFIAIAVCIFLLCGAMFYFIAIPRNMSCMTAENGVLDLTGEDFSNTIFPLDGEWEFYFGELLTPEDFGNSQSAIHNAQLIDVPMSWDTAGYDRLGYATYRLIVKTGEPELLLLIPEIMEAGALWINGVKAFETGRVGRTQASSVKGIKINFVNIRPENGLVEIIVQASNHSYMESGLAYSLELALRQVLLNDMVLRWLLLNIFVGLAFAMFIYHAMLFIYRKNERAYLFFALYCLFTALRFTIASDSIVPFLLPGGFGAGLFSFYMLTITAQSVTVVLFAYTVFDIKFKNKFINIIYCVIYGFASLVALLPAGRLYGNFIIIVLIPLIIVFVKAIRSKCLRESPYNILLVASIGIFIVWAPLIRFLLDIPFMYMSGVFVNMFLLLSQGLMLTISYAEAKKREEELTAKTDFYRRVSHALRTPLTVVSTNIQIANRKKETDHERLSRSQDEIMRMAEMINDALDDRDEIGGGGKD